MDIRADAHRLLDELDEDQVATAAEQIFLTEAALLLHAGRVQKHLAQRDHH